jgi:PAS domain S-box-containing protein
MMNEKDNGIRQSSIGRMLCAVMDASPVAMLAFDQEECVAYANPFAERLFGKKATGILKCGDFIACTNRHKDQEGCGHTADCPGCSLFRAIRSALTTETDDEDVREGEALLVRDPGLDPVWVEFKVSRLSMEGRNVAVMAFKDLTGFKKTADDLKNSNAQFLFLTEALADMVWKMDMNLRTTDVSASVEKILGFTPEERIRQPLEEMVTPECLARIYKIFSDELEKEKQGQHAPDRSLIVEAEYYRKDGTTVWMENIVKAIRDDAGVLIGLYGAARDISERKKFDENWLQAQNLLSNAFEKAAIGMVLFSPDGLYYQVNAAFCTMLGYDESELLSKTFVDITHRDDKAMSLRIVKDMTDGKMDQTFFEKRYLHKSGSVVHVQITMALLRDTNGAPHYFFSQVQNITHQRALKSQLEQAQKMESIGTLAGGIAHDFNNILSSIIGYTELAADMAEKESRQHRYLKEVLTAGNRAKELVSQILTFARQSEVEVKPIRAKYLVKESMKLIRASIPSTIAIREFIQSESLISANPTQIHQVVMNLCTNAAQAMEEHGGMLTIELKDAVVDENLPKLYQPISPGKHLLLSIRDTGQGIGPDIIEKIFDPYFTTKAKGEGTGLGLSVVKGIVDSCKGFIGVNSETGKGTQFDIYFPALEFEAKEKPVPVETEKIPTGNERILFVDDEPPIAALSEQMLSELGYRVIVRSSSIEALELFKDDPERFDLVISDITMPNMAGDALAAEMLKIRSDLPVILCTGYSKRVSDERAKQIGVKAFLYKPIVKRQLAETIRKVLDHG